MYAFIEFCSWRWKETEKLDAADFFNVVCDVQCEQVCGRLALWAWVRHCEKTEKFTEKEISVCTSVLWAM